MRVCEHTLQTSYTYYAILTAFTAKKKGKLLNNISKRNYLVLKQVATNEPTVKTQVNVPRSPMKLQYVILMNYGHSEITLEFHSRN